MKRQIRELFRRAKHEWLGLPPFTIKSTDYFITSWPRSGNTWMRYMLFFALFPEKEWDMLMIEQKMPTIYRRSIRQLADRMIQQPFRLFKTHERFQKYMLTGKTVYIIRNGMDATVSLYNYRKQISQIKTPFSKFLQQTLKNHNRFGSWHRHIAGWLKHKDSESVLIIHYEDMIKDAAAELNRTLKFLGFDVPKERIDFAVEQSNLSRVENGFKKYAEKRDRNFNKGLGGSSGMGQKLMSAEDRALFLRISGDMMRQLGYEHK